MLTEKEARERWCPFARAIVATLESDGKCGEPTDTVGAAVGNRPGSSQILRQTTCYGANCMAWRWRGWPTRFGTIATAPDEEDITGDRIGYCGLAGKPE